MILTPAQQLEGALVRQLLTLPPPVVERLAGTPIERRGQQLDPQVQLVLRLSKLAGKKSSEDLSVATARRQTDVTATQMTAETSPIASIHDRNLGGRPVRIYRPERGERPGPALLYFHGGGFVVGSFDSHDGPCRELAARTACTVIAVDYRLAPEHRFPAAVDDARDVFRALVEQAESLGLDRERLAIGGDSAGGNIAAVLALDTKDDAVVPRFQLLVYPVVDMTMSSPSIDELGEGFFLEKATIIYYRDHYLGEADRKDPRASPLFVDDLSGLPPALVITAGFDPLVDEGRAYADRLREAGVETTLQHHPSLFHGFWNTTSLIRHADRAFDEAVRVTRAALAP